MKRKIVTTIKISKGSIRVVCLESISTNLVEIFNESLWTSVPLEQINFIKQSIAKINSLIFGKVETVIGIIESNKTTNLEIQVLEKEVPIPSAFVTKKDIKNVMALANRDGIKEGKQIILTQPIQFRLTDLIEKSYNKAPINKKGHILKAKIAVSTIASDVHKYLMDVITGAGLKVSQVLSDTHTFSQGTISNSALAAGAISVHTSMERTTISVNVDSAVVSSLELKLGFKDLIKMVSERITCSQEIALDLIKIYGDLDLSNEEVIFTSNQGIRIVSHTAKYLNAIIVQFIKKIAQYTQAFIEKHDSLKKLPVTLSGEISILKGMDKITQDIFSSEYVNTYKPLSFIASNASNLETIAVSNLINRLDEVIGEKFSTIVMTNPNSFDSLKGNKMKWLTKLMENITGGKYARTTT